MKHDIDTSPAVQGAHVLDRMYPGWEHKIDTSILSLSSSKTCILGQLYGHFTTGCLALREEGLLYATGSYGFVTLDQPTTKAMEGEWVRQVRNRLLIPDEVRRNHYQLVQSIIAREQIAVEQSTAEYILVA